MSNKVTWPEQLETLRGYASKCTRCHLRSGCTQVVFGQGNPEADIMFIGEGPGKQEDAEGKPFVGPAGQLLDVILEKMGVDKDKIYITNVVKCRPPGNREPTKEEVEACNWIIEQEIKFINPRVIVALGSVAAKALLGDDIKITKDRGQWFSYKDHAVTIAYHPAYVLHSEVHKTPEEVAKIKWDVWNDLKEAFKSVGMLGVFKNR